MIKRKMLILTLALVSLGPLARPQSANNTLSLTLEECILKALQNNLGLTIQQLAPLQAEYSLQLTKEKFIPSFAFNFTNGETRNASYSWLDAPTDSSFTQTGRLSGSLSQAVPTGGNLTIGMSGNRTYSNARLQTINPRYDARLQFQFSQPLLRDFGPKMSRRQIILAQSGLEKAGYDFQANVAGLIYNVETAYWNLVYSIENLKVVRLSLKLAQDLLNQNRLAVEIGTMAPRDVLTAQSSVASREADIIAAEASVKSAEDTLRSILNLMGDAKAAGAIIPADQPNLDIKPVELDQSILVAMQNRPELKSLEIDLDNSKFSFTIAKNQLLPNLSLSASYTSPGISGDRILYLNNNPLSGVIVGVVPAGVSQAIKDSLKFLYKNWSVGLTLDIPLSNILSRASVAQAQVSLQSAELQLKSREQAIYLEIKSAVRDLETNSRRVQALKVASDLADQNLKSEEEKLRVGLSTPYQVLQFQEQLTRAKTTELQAIINLNNAQAKLDQVLGTSLETRNIKIEELLDRD